ncbi:MAG: SgcJ/EcaC family oxidoreductase [Bacteroidales bacterium]|nr:SgcJ/EcaC family oxidoreductase [Bacteroidales bacterium]
MKRINFVISALAVIPALVFAKIEPITGQNNQTPEMKRVNKQRDKESVLKVEAAYDQAWRVGDVEGIVACLKKDAVLISPRGEVASGHQEIRKLFGELLSGPAKGSTHTSRIIRVNFVTDHVAVLDGEALIEGGEFDDLSSLAHHMFTDILVRSGDVWLIAQIRAYVKY